jgi:polyisoprenoid-binding protein YceI
MQLRFSVYLAPVALTAGVVLTATPGGAATYTFEPKHTEVRFACSIGLGTQRGHFTRVEGQVEYEPAMPDSTKVAARVATASLTTGEPMMDDTLKGSDFFNVRSYPRMVFVSHSVHATGTHTAVMKGDITVNGITRPVKLAVSIAPEQAKRGRDVLELVARTHIKRSAFNMTAFPAMASDDVEIEIDAQLRKTP